MAKIDRYNGNLVAFAQDAPGTERTIFGDTAQSNALTDQINADFLRGWGIVGPSDQPTLQDFNAMGYTHGQLLAYLHQVGVPEYNAAQEYHTGSITNESGVLYSSLVDNNVGNTPSASPSQWEQFGVDTVTDAAVVAIASASTVDLVTNAPSTRKIRITGSITINSFVILEGQEYTAAFSGAATLTNSASLVTNEGANIVTASGDSCVIRATAANTVEILLYRKAKAESTAWVRFNGTGTPAITDSLNVSSITDNGVGDYTINFLSPMTNANYTFSAAAISTGANNSTVVSLKFGTTPTTSGFTVRTVNLSNGAPSSASFADCEMINCTVFGGK